MHSYPTRGPLGKPEGPFVFGLDDMTFAVYRYAMPRPKSKKHSSVLALIASGLSHAEVGRLVGMSPGNVAVIASRKKGELARHTLAQWEVHSSLALRVPIAAPDIRLQRLESMYHGTRSRPLKLRILDQARQEVAALPGYQEVFQKAMAAGKVEGGGGQESGPRAAYNILVTDWVPGSLAQALQVDGAGRPLASSVEGRTPVQAPIPGTALDGPRINTDHGTQSNMPDPGIGRPGGACTAGTDLASGKSCAIGSPDLDILRPTGGHPDSGKRCLRSWAVYYRPEIGKLYFTRKGQRVEE